MELTFEELNDIAQSQDDTTSFKNNYWNNQSEPATPKNVRFSYDDIRSSLNLVVQNGVLKQIQVKPDPQQNRAVAPRTPVEQPAKNSYIYNKYFKDYNDPSIVKEPEVPLTLEERRQQAYNDYLRRIAEKKRIEQIKSKKLLFNTSNIHFAPNNGNLNKMFRMQR